MATNDIIETIEDNNLVTATGGKAPPPICAPVSPWARPGYTPRWWGYPSHGGPGRWSQPSRWAQPSRWQRPWWGFGR